MSFVWSIWYIVALVLVAGIVASLIVFFKMDKQDKVIIDNFIKESQSSQEEEKDEKAEKSE